MGVRMSHQPRLSPYSGGLDMTTVTVGIYRYDPTDDTEPRIQRYEVPCQRRMNVRSVLSYIYENIDPTLAFRNYECSRGICNACRVNVDGRQVKACSVRVRPGDYLDVRPYQEKRVIRDLVCYEE